MPHNIERPRPHGWNESPLFNFIEDCWGNSLATFANKGLICQRLTEIDRVFDDLQQKELKPKKTSELLPIFFFLRSFTAFRAGIMVSTSLPTDGYALHRSCLENAGYAAVVAADRTISTADAFLRRDESRVARQRMRDIFSQKEIRTAIIAHDDKLAETFQALYERCIDWGAHPNEKSLTASLVKESFADTTTTLQMKLLPGDGPVFDLSLRTAAQIGVCVLRIFSFLIPSAFDPTIQERIISLRSGL